MLTKELAIAEYDFAGGRIVPDRLTRKTHRRYLGYARRMVTLNDEAIRRLARWQEKR